MHYEAMLILPPDEEKAPLIVEEIKDLIVKSSGKEITVDTWGIRNLAFPIGQYTSGYYVLIKFDMRPNKEMLKELDQKIKYHEAVIRHLLVKEIKAQ